MAAKIKVKGKKGINTEVGNALFPSIARTQRAANKLLAKNLATKTGISYITLYKRLERGMTPAEAFFKPVRPYRIAA